MAQESDPLVDKLVAETAWLEDAPCAPEFGHAYVEVDLRLVVAMLARILPTHLPSVPGIFSECFSPHRERRVFLTSIAAGTILWHAPRDLPVVAELSRRFPCAVHWIFLYAEIRFPPHCRFFSVQGTTASC